MLIKGTGTLWACLGKELTANGYWLLAVGLRFGSGNEFVVGSNSFRFAPAGLSPPRCTSLATFPMASPDRRRDLYRTFPVARPRYLPSLDGSELEDEFAFAAFRRSISSPP